MQKNEMLLWSWLKGKNKYLTMGCNRRFKLRKLDIGSKGLARDTIHNKGGYLAVGFNKSKKNASIILPKCICEM